MARYRKAKRDLGLSGEDPRHGTTNGYQNHGCRCLDCTHAAVEANRQWR
jgi:hypothetical protein